MTNRGILTIGTDGLQTAGEWPESGAKASQSRRWRDFLPASNLAERLDGGRFSAAF